jgi:hypothetical protein
MFSIKHKKKISPTSVTTLEPIASFILQKVQASSPTQQNAMMILKKQRKSLLLR